MKLNHSWVTFVLYRKLPYKSKIRSQVLYDVQWMVLLNFPKRVRTAPNLAKKHEIKITSQYNKLMWLTRGSIQVWISPLIMHVTGPRLK